MKRVSGWIIVVLAMAACVGLVVAGLRGKSRPTRAADSRAHGRATTQRVQERGIDPAAAPMAQLLAIARQEATRWQRDAQLVTVRVAPNPSGLIDLMRAAPGADFSFWSDRADDCLGVMFRQGGEIHPYAHAEPLDKKEIPGTFLDIEQALSQARADDWNQRVERAVLAWRQKKGYPGRLACTIVGDRSVPDDRVYCIDAITGKPFLAIEIEEFLETPSDGDQHWLAGRLARVMQPEGMNAIWQVVDVEHDGMKVIVPVRPLNDREREKILAGDPQSVVAGPVVKLTAEQKRIFRSSLKDRAIEVAVEPGMVLSSEADRDAVKHAVEAEYARRGNPRAGR